MEFIGKSLLIEEEGARILVIGDLHLGYEEGTRRAGLELPLGIYKKTISEFDEIFDKLERENKRIEIVVLLGDRDFEEIHDRKIKTWVMGHFHPAIDLEDKAKSERYKCFLVGKYSGREVVIVPSFFGINEGMDLRDKEYNLRGIFDFDFNKFNVWVIGEELEVLDFGK